MKRAMTRQSDLFGRAPPQGELFGVSKAPVQVAPVTSDSVREKMLTMLAQLRAADRMPWPERKARINEVIFPQMANWLPDDEANQFRFEFAQELERLRQAA